MLPLQSLISAKPIVVYNLVKFSKLNGFEDKELDSFPEVTKFLMQNSRLADALYDVLLPISAGLAVSRL